MTKRDFFRILIKIFALYSLILTVFSWIPSNLIYIVYDFELKPVLVTLGFICLAFLIYYILINKTDQIIDFIKLDKGFDDPNIVLGKLGTDKILMLGIILVGGLVLISNLADFIQYSFLAFKKEVQNDGLNRILDNSFGTTADYFNWTFSGINVILGYVLLTNYDRVTNWLNRKEKNVGDTI